VVWIKRLSPCPAWSTILAVSVLAALAALPACAGAFSTPAATSDSYWAAWTPAVVADEHWVIFPTDTGFVVWNDRSHEAHASNFGCSDEAGGGQDGIMVGGPEGPGGGRITMTEDGLLYAVLDVGTVWPEQWGSIAGAGLPNTNTSICDAVADEYDPSHDAFAREEELQPREAGLWTNPITGQPQEALDVLAVSTDEGQSWHLVSAPRASVTIGNVAGGYGAVGGGHGADEAGDMLLMPAGDGVRWGDPGYGYTTYSGAGLSAVADAGDSYGFDFGSGPDPQGSLEPGTRGPKGYTLTATRRLSDGATWALWQPSWVSGGGEAHVNYAAQMTVTLDGRVSRVTVDPKLQVAASLGSTPVSPGCVMPQTATSEGIYTAMPSGSGQTIYATTPVEAAWRPGCHNKYVSVNAVEASQIVIASHDDGRTWERVAAPALGAGTRAYDVLTVDGDDPVVGFSSNRFSCSREGGLMYERLSDGRWEQIGCRKTEAE